MANEGEKADEILLSYHHQDGKTGKELFQSIPKLTLLKVIELLNIVKNQGVVGDNSCPTCGHRHGNANSHYSRRMLMLDRAKQTLNNTWKE